MPTAADPNQKREITDADVFDFPDLKPKEFGPFRLGEQMYVLRAATSAVGTTYRNMGIKAMRMKDGGISGAEGLASTEPYLVEKCLFRDDGAGNFRIPVTAGFVAALPDPIVKRLFDKAEKISDLNRKPPETAKKEADAEEAAVKN